MLLAADIGNSNICLGLFQEDKLLEFWRLSTDMRRTADEHAQQLDQLLGKRRRRVRALAVASVVPTLKSAFQGCSRRLFNREAIVIDHTSPLGFTIGCRPPEDVGADRLVDAAAAIHRHGAPVVVVDFGTAVTLSVVSRARVYLGGVIAPGLELAAESLFRRTAKLPLVDLAEPRSAIGSSTLESIRSGVILGYAGLVDGLLDRTFRELKDTPRVVATGGTAHLVVPHCRYVRKMEQDLTMEGIRLVARRMMKGRKL